MFVRHFFFSLRHQSGQQRVCRLKAHPCYGRVHSQPFSGRLQQTASQSKSAYPCSPAISWAYRPTCAPVKPRQCSSVRISVVHTGPMSAQSPPSRASGTVRLCRQTLSPTAAPAAIRHRDRVADLLNHAGVAAQQGSALPRVLGAGLAQQVKSWHRSSRPSPQAARGRRGQSPRRWQPSSHARSGGAPQG